MRHRKKYSVYMNNEAMTLKNKKQRLCKKYATSKCVQDHDNFVKCKHNLRKLIRPLKEICERTLSHNKLKPFWSYVFSKLKTRVRIPTLSKVDGEGGGGGGGKSAKFEGEG